MLNRLMFCYFIQKKGFLDNNKNYLMNKLQETKEKYGRDKFYSFYRVFLLKLFHKGLGSPDHSAKLEAELGKIPYLNGGLFDEHELEKNYDIQIEDKAFEKLFKFFDEWQWHLDTRHTATGNEINPDVIGYIFEKYINDRAQMGAYYTKEDITDYISKNCILPYLFDETRRHYKEAFQPDGEIWTMLKNSGDTYIYDAVKKGIDPENPWGDLPSDIKAGLDPNQEDLVEKRRCWNRPAPEETALPTEIWREVIERRKRYLEVRQKIENGEITGINDFITYNLNIRAFAQDVVLYTADPELILHFYKSIAGDGKTRKPISILDPTCGSGAFLFAALNILEPLYEYCIVRMRNFVDEEDRLNSADRASFRHKYRFFREVLEQIKSPAHPNEKYFIYKSIILNNLYGVDIMKEAVEIAKLRLFLQLVATVDADYGKENLGLEPLPDVDFNIRAGNTLVGFATEAELQKALESELDFGGDKDRITEECEVVSRTFQRYKEIQLSYGDDYKAFRAAKEELIKRLRKLNRELNRILHKQYAAIKYDEWLETHQPFHWFAEFYEIVHGRGGFDVIIGNPPYVSFRKVGYRLMDYSVLESGNLYACVMERSTTIVHKSSRFSMIIPVSILAGDNFVELAKLVFRNLSWTSSFSNRPGKLFYGVEQRLSIVLMSMESGLSFSSEYQHWYEIERPSLFENLSFNTAAHTINRPSPLKTGHKLSRIIADKIYRQAATLNSMMGKSRHRCFFHDGPTYWIRSLPFEPSGNKNSNSTHYHALQGLDEINAMAMTSILSSATFYFHFKITSNCRDFGIKEISSFRLPAAMDLEQLHVYAKAMGKQLKETARTCSRDYDSGVVKYDEYYPVMAKDVIDEIDKVLAKHYGFTPEELDFIINYDIKYRMGKELEEGE